LSFVAGFETGKDISRLVKEAFHGCSTANLAVMDDGHATGLSVAIAILAMLQTVLIYLHLFQILSIRLK